MIYLIGGFKVYLVALTSDVNRAIIVAIILPFGRPFYVDGEMITR